MTDEQFRPDVVQRLLDAALSQDLSAYESACMDATPGEMSRAYVAQGEIYRARMESGHDERQLAAWHIMFPEGSLANGAGWDEIWNALDDEKRDQLWPLLDAIPEPVAGWLMAWREGHG